MNSAIISNGYNDVINDEFIGSKGKFGYDKTNPIPINGLDNLEAYFDKIRYKYASVADIKSLIGPVMLSCFGLIEVLFASQSACQS